MNASSKQFAEQRSSKTVTLICNKDPQRSYLVCFSPLIEWSQIPVADGGLQMLLSTALHEPIILCFPAMTEYLLRIWFLGFAGTPVRAARKSSALAFPRRKWLSEGERPERDTGILAVTVDTGSCIRCRL